MGTPDASRAGQSDHPTCVGRRSAGHVHQRVHRSTQGRRPVSRFFGGPARSAAACDRPCAGAGRSCDATDFHAGQPRVGGDQRHRRCGPETSRFGPPRTGPAASAGTPRHRHRSITGVPRMPSEKSLRRACNAEAGSGLHRRRADLPGVDETPAASTATGTGGGRLRLDRGRADRPCRMAGHHATGPSCNVQRARVACRASRPADRPAHRPRDVGTTACQHDV